MKNRFAITAELGSYFCKACGNTVLDKLFVLVFGTECEEQK